MYVCVYIKGILQIVCTSSEFDWQSSTSAKIGFTDLVQARSGIFAIQLEAMGLVEADIRSFNDRKLTIMTDTMHLPTIRSITMPPWK